MAVPLRISIYLTAVFMTVIMSGVLVLGTVHYQHQKQHGIIISQSESLLFQYATIREHIVEALLDNRQNVLPAISHEVESFRSNLSKLIGNPLIPDEYKLSFMNQIDLSSIILLLRQAGEKKITGEKLQQLNRESRKLFERLALFDRMLVNYSKSKVIGFQKVAIGALAIILFIIVNILVLAHRSVATPLLMLVRQVREVAQGKRSDVSMGLTNISREVADLASSFHNLIANRIRDLEAGARIERIMFAVHKAGRAAMQSVTVQQLFDEVGRALLYNSDYCLVWAGLTDQSGEKLSPVLVDGMVLKNDSKSEICLTYLLGRGNSKVDCPEVSLHVLKEAGSIIERDIVAVGSRQLEDTILAGVTVDCLALPVVWGNTFHGVLNIYSTGENSFNDEETKLLDKMAHDMGFALNCITVQTELQVARRLYRNLFDAFPVAALVVDSEDNIIDANEAAGKTLGEEHPVMGQAIKNLLRIDYGGDKVSSICATLENHGLRFLDGKLIADSKNYKVALTPFEHLENAGPAGLVVLNEQTGDMLEGFDIVQASKLAVVGELSSGIANEINNLSNGIINYAQVLGDEIRESESCGEHGKVLDTIISEGERIAEIAQKFFVYGGEKKQAREMASMRDMVDDALLLVKHNLKNDGVVLSVDIAGNLPGVLLNIQSMQLVFLILLNRARKSLNVRYAEKNDNKRLEVSAQLASIDNVKCVSVTVKDCGAGIESYIIDQVFDAVPEFKSFGNNVIQRLAICRRLVEQEHQGHFAVERDGMGCTSVIISLPVHVNKL